MNCTVQLSGIERTFAEDEIIVSKTDLEGRITYANDVFIEVSGYSEEELLGQPQNLVRHPQMPACIYNMIWETLAEGGEIFAYLANRCANGDHYWVFALLSPSYARDGAINGYHSSQRVPNPLALEKIKELYAELLDEETRASDTRQGIETATNTLNGVTSQQETSYDQMVFSLQALQPAVN